MSVRSMLMLFAAVPLLGGVAVGYLQIDDAFDERDRIADIETQVDELIWITEVRAAIIEERNWASANRVVEATGVSSALVSVALGVDVDDEFEAARIRVDTLLTEDDEVRSTVESIRSEYEGADVRSIDDLSRVTIEFLLLEARLGLEADRRLDGLLDASGRTIAGDDLIRSLRVFDRASILRSSIAASSNASLSIYFDTSAPQAESPYVVLVRERSRTRELVEEIERIAEPESAVIVALDELFAIASTQRFEELVDDIIEAGSDVGPIELDQVGERLDDLTTAFADGTQTAEASLTIVNAAGQDVSSAAEDLRRRAQDGAARTAIIVVAGSLLALGLALFLVRSIVRPLRRLHDGAVRIRDGISDVPIREDGPLEIHQTAQALNEATASLAHFRSRTDALARGDLRAVADEPVAESTGALGESVRAAVATLAESINARDELRQKLIHEASHDGLTQIANRRASLDALRASLASQGDDTSTTAVLFVDLDGFKRVNDQFGHRAGDTALRVVARRLRSALGDEAHVGRLGGDEFIVVMTTSSTISVAIEETSSIAHRLIDVVTGPIEVEGATIHLSACVGIAFDDTPAATAQTLLHEADVAVYQAKRAGSGSVCVCDARMRDEIRRSVELDSELRRALHTDEFELWTQPVVAAGSLVEASREVLIRWRHPERGLVFPGDFIEFAERSDLIVEIDRWVLARAAELLAADPDGTPIAVNISGRHLGSDLFLDDVLAPLRAHDVDPSRIIVEVTESSLLDDLELAAGRLDRLRELGVRVAIDDFGTGYASLSYLRRLPVDIVKIDRSFTRDESSRSLVRMVVETARLLDLGVTAEGVEDEAQTEALRSLGVDWLQGYHFGRPRPPRRERPTDPIRLGRGSMRGDVSAATL